ncbi:uncharacterized protein [Nicotiana sylvestris]|uniref:uncharacterized protein n=1 Tax=Nicotiana sylvestris TaxID=4096 RepID=UPI00388CBAD7
MEEEKKLARNNRINIRKQKRPKICSDKNGDGFGKEKKTQPLADITNRQHFPRLNYTPLESCAHASSSQSQAQYPNLPTQQHLQFGLSTSNVQTNFLLPDLNEIPLLPELDDVNIDGDVAEINDATEDEDDYEDPDVGYGIIDNEVAAVKVINTRSCAGNKLPKQACHLASSTMHLGSI